jgi:RNA polymerase sigma-70 factor (ECF subfamily)
LESIIEALPEQCRRAFRLQKFSGLSQRDIAQTMNISEKTVEKHLAGALVRILEALSKGSESAPAGSARKESGGLGNDAQQSND